MKLLVLITASIAACSFAPQQASSLDAPDTRAPDTREPDTREIDAQVDGHQLPSDAKMFLDAPPPTPFDVSMCPASYISTVSSTSTVSRYRITGTGNAAWAEAACEADHPGWTHLLVAGVTGESGQIAAIIPGHAVFWLGAVQPKNQATPATGWVWASGAPVPVNAWSANQPNDNADGTEDNDQNFAYVDFASGTINDSGANYSFNGVCECDGVPVPANVQAYFAQ